MDTQLGRYLVYVARSAIAMRLGLEVGASPALTGVMEETIAEPGAVFVTLTQNHQLRGCVGSLHATRALWLDCEQNALAAAFDDDRFEPLSVDEFGSVQIEISRVGEALPFGFENEEDACERLRLGVDGVILTYRNHRATFLPQVWASLPDPKEFLAQLKRKAGLDPHFWSPELELSVYEVDSYKER